MSGQSLFIKGAISHRTVTFRILGLQCTCPSQQPWFGFFHKLVILKACSHQNQSFILPWPWNNPGSCYRNRTRNRCDDAPLCSQNFSLALLGGFTTWLVIVRLIDASIAIGVMEATANEFWVLWLWSPHHIDASQALSVDELCLRTTRGS